MIISAPSIKPTISINLPSSKSICNRVLAINALSGNQQFPQNLSDCDDTRVMTEWLKRRPKTVDVGAAGTAMRFSTALLTISDGEHVITGSERMKQRPIHVLVDSLNRLGADVTYLEQTGFPPLHINGNPCLDGGELTLRGDVSSQYVSALLMIAPLMTKGLTLHLSGDIISRPYIDMTLGVMQEFGASADWISYDTIHVNPGRYKCRDYVVESDWSASSYWYAVAALSPDVEQVFLPGLSCESLQGDSEVAEIFEMLGLTTDFVLPANGPMVARISRTGDVKSRLDYDFVNQPDLAQTLTVCCCMMGVPFRFTGLSTLRIKETDRLAALQTELAKLGYDIEETGGHTLSWDGSMRALTADERSRVAIDTYDDHRMAMAFAPACLRVGPLRINNPQVVSKSYPAFWNDMETAGFNLSDD